MTSIQKAGHPTLKTAQELEAEAAAGEVNKLAKAVPGFGSKNVVVTDTQQNQAKTVDSRDLHIDRSAKEDGHGGGTVDKSPPAPSAAQLEFERKTKEREDVIKQNTAIKESNSNLNTQIGKLETAKTHLTALANIFDISASFTKGELNDFANSMFLSAETKAAARWLLAQDDAALAALGLKKNEGGVTKESINAALGAMEGKIADLKAQIRPELPVPGEPTPPPSSSTNPSTGTGGTTGPGGTSGSGQTQETGAEFDARVFGNYKKVPPFSSNATSPEGRLQDAGSYIQKGLDALQEDLIAASTKSPPNQGEIMAIQNKMQQVQSAFAAVMQMMKQLQEMQSNMSKMFNDMAAAAIRNMR